MFGKFVALNNISAEFTAGAITSIIGPNGAGKSTYFNLLSGAFAPSSGSVEFEGRDVTGLPQHRFAHMGIAKSFQITNVFPQLTTRENIRVGLQALVSRYDMWRPRARLPELTEQADELLALVGLWESRERTRQTLAHGEQRALEIGMALASRPRLLLLDEPTAGMSPEETRVMMDLIVKLAGERTVILVEHKMKLVLGHQRPHPGAAPRRAAGRRHAARGAPERGGEAGLSRPAGALSAMLQDQQSERLVRREPCAAGRQSRGGQGRDRLPDRPQRRRQDHDAEIDHGADGQDARLGRSSRARSC